MPKNYELPDGFTEVKEFSDNETSTIEQNKKPSGNYSLPPGFIEVQEFENNGTTKKSGATSTPDNKEYSWGRYLEGLKDSALQGLSFGFADELEGAVDAALAGDWSQYEKSRDARRKKVHDFSEKYPVASFSAELVPLLIPGNGIARAVTGVGKAVFGAGNTLAKIAARAGMEAGIYSAGKAEGSAADQARQTLTGAAFGGALGAGAHRLITAAGTSGRVQKALDLIDSAKTRGSKLKNQLAELVGKTKAGKISAIHENNQLFNTLNRQQLDAPRVMFAGNTVKSAAAKQSGTVLGSPIKRAFDKFEDEAANKLSGLGEKLTQNQSLSDHKIGETISEAVKQEIKRISDKSGSIYNQIRELAPGNIKAPLNNTRKALSEIIEARKAIYGAGSDMYPIAEGTAKMLLDENTTRSVGEMLKIRSKIRRAASKEKVLTEKHELLNIEDALSQDIKNLLEQSDQPQLIKQLDEANSLWGKKYQLENDFSKLMGDKSYEDVFKHVSGLINAGNGRGNLASLKQIKDHIGDELLQNVVGLELLAKGSEHKPASVINYLKNYNKMGNGVKDVVFASKPEVRQSLDDLSAIIAERNRFMADFNVSRSGTALIDAATYIGGAGAAGAALAGVKNAAYVIPAAGAAYGWASLLGSRIGAKELSKVARLGNKILRIEKSRGEKLTQEELYKILKPLHEKITEMAATNPMLAYSFSQAAASVLNPETTPQSDNKEPDNA